MKIQLTAKHREVISDLFTNLAAGFFGSIIIFPGVFGIRSYFDLLPLLLINLPVAILFIATAIKLKEI